MKLLLFVGLLQLVIFEKVATQKPIYRHYKWGESEPNEKHLYYKKVWTEFSGESLFRYPEAGYQHNFRITRMEVKDYNEYFAHTERLTPGINQTYVHFRFESRELRALDMDFDIWGVYIGNCASK